MKKVLKTFLITSLAFFGVLAFNFNASAEEITITENSQKAEEINEKLSLKRSATQEEFDKINSVINDKMKKDEEINMEQILKDLKLDDVGYKEADKSVIDLSVDAPINLQGATTYGILNVGSVHFANPSHTETYLKATLQCSNIGIGKLDLVFGSILPYTKASNGSYIQNGTIKYFEKTNVGVGSTDLSTHQAVHKNIGAKLEAATGITDAGKTQVLDIASISYTVKK